MEAGFYSIWKDRSRHVVEDAEENDELKQFSSLPSIARPQTPQEPIEFLSRSWSLSASEISKALSENQKPRLTQSPYKFPEPSTTPQPPGKVVNSYNGRRMSKVRKWFHQKEYRNNITVIKKDRARLENSHMHSALSVAGLAAALAARTAADKSGGSASKLSMSLASATELLASHCFEMAELSGADHDHVASVVRSAVDIQTPGDLMTLTAAAATALRGEAALKARLPNQVKKNAAISPDDRGITETYWLPTFYAQLEKHHPPCVGDLLQQTRKGLLRWKRVSVYINKKSQVIIKLKSTHVGGAFSKNNKSIVYGVCDKDTAWPYKREREVLEDLYFGLKTAQGLLEFKCKSKIHKQRWVAGIESLLFRVSCFKETEHSLELLSINNSI